MAEKILLIQPRWMTGAMTRQKVQLWCEKYPRAVVTLLSPAPLENIIGTNLIFPPLEPQKMAQFARKLRRTRFRRAIILADTGQGDVGNGEAKLWAFVAKARRREFEGKPFTVWREAKAKRKVALILAVHSLEAICEILHRPQREILDTATQEAWKSAHTFVYLQHAMHQHNLAAGRVLLIGTHWSAQAAKRCGWQPVMPSEEVLVHLILADDSATIQEHQLSGLKSGSLLCLCGCEENEFSFSFLRTVDSRPSFFDGEKTDVWMVRES